MGPFRKGGTLVSNGDIGLGDAVDPKSAVDFTGNTHGSMVEVNGKYYVFAHRQTNKCQFSRQGLAEEKFIEDVDQVIGEELYVQVTEEAKVQTSTNQETEEAKQ